MEYSAGIGNSTYIKTWRSWLSGLLVVVGGTTEKHSQQHRKGPLTMIPSIRTIALGLTGLGVLIDGAFAHPNENHSAETVKKSIAAADIAARHAKRASSACSSSAQSQPLMARAAERRAMTAQILRENRGIVDSMKTQIMSRDPLLTTPRANDV